MTTGGPRARTSPPGAARALFPSYRVFISALFTLLFLAALCALLSSNPAAPDATDGNPDPSSSAAAAAGLLRPNYVRRVTFLAIQSDPLRTRLGLVYRQAADHAALVNAYASYARRLKLDSARLLHSFEELVASFASILARLPAADTAAALDDDGLRALEKELKDRVKLARQLVGESKESFDTQLKIQKLRDTVFAVGEQLNRARKLGGLSSRIAAGSTPKSLHCLAMRLMEERVAHPEAYVDAGSVGDGGDPDLADPDLYHYALFSDNVVAASVVVNSAVRNAADPSKHVFHLVTDRMHLAAFQVWFHRRPPPGGARVEIRSDADFPFLNASYSPAVRMDLPLLDHLKFYLPEMYPRLRRVILLEDDVVVQRDMAGLWWTDLEGKVNGAVEMCFGSFRRYSQYLNFSHPVVRERFSPRACAWAYGVNIFDLDAWRREKSTEQYHYYQNLNEDGTLWKPGTTLPAGLMTFYMSTKPLDKTWHLMGLGYNPSISQDEISRAAVIHFNGHMKPWLDVAMNQYKHLWTKYVDTDMEFLQLCNFGL